jgi:NAD(P)-dependent dehydrogenase (short-subunit alcohol dehydrogenase family)
MSATTFRYDGKRVLVVGGATGMGAAAAKTVAELGADVIVMDVAPIDYSATQTLKVDLRDKASVDAAIDQVAGPIHAIFSCAGISDGQGLMLINFIAQRHLIDRMLAAGKLGRGAAIAMISSAGGMGWQGNLPQLVEFLRCEDWGSAAAWVDAHDGTDNYVFSKQAMNAYVAREAFELVRKGIRLNAVLPGPTDTPLARANADVWLAFGAPFRKEVGRDPLTPEEIGNTLVFLCSDAASGMNGATLIVDHGHVNATLAGAYEDQSIDALLGRTR